MATFEPAFSYMIVNEAGPHISDVVTAEPNGGKARFGINSVAHPKAVTDGFYTMRYDQALQYAKSVYLHDYWNGRGFDQLASQQLATKLFDMAVNTGTGGELGVLQEALGVPVTHKFDAATQAALSKATAAIIPQVVSHLKAHYQAVFNTNPQKYAKVLSNWLSRAAKLPPADA